MVCGYGDSISYDQLVYRITSERVDKSSRFTDWKRRPLSQKQLEYALADVTHLRDVYQSIKANLEEQNRAHWVTEEMEILTSRDTYDLPPEQAWQRLKLRVRKPREFALMKQIAQWRETMARQHNVPRGRIIKDEAIYEICAHPPQSLTDLAELRGLARGFDKGRYGNEEHQHRSQCAFDAKNRIAFASADAAGARRCWRRYRNAQGTAQVHR